MTVTTNPSVNGDPQSSVSGAGNASRSGPLLVAVLGDSISQDGYSVTTAGASYLPHGYMTWAMGFSMGALWCPLVATPNSATPLLNYNRAVSGETAAQTLARVSELSALPVKPSFCVIATGTNSIGAASPGSATSIAATIISICTGVLALGITPVLCTLLPRGNGTSSGAGNGWGNLSTAAQVQNAKALLLEVNRQLRTYAGVTPGVILADIFHSIVDYTTTWSDPVSTLTGRSTATPDYVHPCVPGAVRVGRVVWNAIAPFVAPAVRQAAGSGDAWDGTYNVFGSMFDSSFSAGGGSAGTGVSSPAAWAGTTAYAVNALVINAAGVSYKCAVAGTSGSVAPTVTAGQQIDGTVVWQPLSTAATAGPPAAMTSNRLTGASATATQLTQSAQGGRVGNETVYAVTSAENAQFRVYTTSGGSVIPNGNFSLGDVIYAEAEFDWDCGSGGYYGWPDFNLRWSGSAYVGTYQVNAAGINAVGINTHVQGTGSVLLRSPLIDAGATTLLSGINFWLLAGARSSGSGAVLTAIRNVTVRKYNKAAAGALTWTAAV